jgi:predicted transcriptional regulator
MTAGLLVSYSGLKSLVTKSLVARLIDQERKEAASRGIVTSMPPKRSITLTQAELRLMKILWDRGESTVAEMADAIPAEETLAYNSVLTTIRILETKGYVSHRQEGRAFLYSTSIGEMEASRSEVRHVLQRFFGNSRERLLLSLLGDDEISPEELRRLKEAIASAPDEALEES